MQIELCPETVTYSNDAPWSPQSHKPKKVYNLSTILVALAPTCSKQFSVLHQDTIYSKQGIRSPATIYIHTHSNCRTPPQRTAETPCSVYTLVPFPKMQIIFPYHGRTKQTKKGRKEGRVVSKPQVRLHLTKQA